MKLKHLIGKSFTIQQQADSYNVSRYQARKQIERAIQHGNIEKYNGKFYVISDDYSISTPAIQKKLINKAKINLEITRLMNNNYIYDKKFMAFIDVSPSHAIIYFPLCKKQVTLDLNEPVIHWKHRLILTRHNIKVI